MEINIDNRQEKFKINEDIISLVEKTIRECLRVEGIEKDHEVSLSFVTDQEIKELNRDYRGVDSSTDVLSFPIEDEFELGLPLLGDIVISLDTANRQAEEYQHSIDREISYLVCHSMFHLFGYNHEDEEEKKEMRSKEKKVMKNLRIYKGE